MSRSPDAASGNGISFILRRHRSAAAGRPPRRRSWAASTSRLIVFAAGDLRVARRSVRHPGGRQRLFHPSTRSRVRGLWMYSGGRRFCRCGLSTRRRHPDHSSRSMHLCSSRTSWRPTLSRPPPPPNIPDREQDLGVHRRPVQQYVAVLHRHFSLLFLTMGFTDSTAFKFSSRTRRPTAAAQERQGSSPASGRAARRRTTLARVVTRITFAGRR